MGRIYVTKPMSYSWKGLNFMSRLNGVNSPKINPLKFIYIGMIYILFSKEFPCNKILPMYRLTSNILLSRKELRHEVPL